MRGSKHESWIEARAAINRGQGMRPRHARAGRHAARPTGYLAFTVMSGREFYGWTRESLAQAERVA